MAPNHECHIDNIFVASLLPKETQKAMAVIGKKEHFDRWFTRLFAKLCHAIPVDRGQVSSSVLQIASHILRRGGVMLIHPEGTRSPGGELLPYKVGAALLADYNKCPIIPVHIEGAHEFWPKDALLPRRFRKITVTFDKPLIPVQDPSPKTRIVQKAAQVLTKQLRERALQLRMMKKAKPGDFDGVRNGSRYL